MPTQEEQAYWDMLLDEALDNGPEDALDQECVAYVECRDCDTVPRMIDYEA